jgi:hypothetical protein
MGILVSCKASKAKARKASAPCQTKLTVAFAAAAVGPGRTIGAQAYVQASRSRAVHAAALVVGLLFLLALAVAGLHLWVLSADDPATAHSQAVVAAAPVNQHKFPVAQKQAAVALNSKTAAAVINPAKKDPAPRPAPTPTAVVQRDNDTGSEQTALIPDDPASVEKVEVAKIKPVSAKEPFEKLVQDAACKEGGDSCSTGQGKGSGDFFGTAVTFLPSPKIAGDEANKEHKLLFVLHVSGNFEDPGFT